MVNSIIIDHDWIVAKNKINTRRSSFEKISLLLISWLYPVVADVKSNSLPTFTNQVFLSGNNKNKQTIGLLVIQIDCMNFL